MFVKARVLVLVKPFQSSPMFAGNAKAYPSEAPFGLHTNIEHRLDGDKHSSLLRALINYGRKSFMTLDPDDRFFTFFQIPICLNLRNDILSKRHFVKTTFSQTNFSEKRPYFQHFIFIPLTLKY